MSKDLSIEEAAELRANPNVVSVIGQRITFSKDFKQLAYRQMLDGKTARMIFEENGIDPEALGNARVWGFAEKVRRQAAREGGFEDLRSQNSRKPAEKSREKELADEVDQLKHEMAYMQQQIEFLKKIHMADLEARKQWESKHLQK